MAKSSDSRDALSFLAEDDSTPVPPVCALFGGEDFLKQLVMQRLKRRVGGGDGGEFSVTEFNGPEAAARDVFDALSTISLFGGGRRLVIVEDADKFVTTFRGKLEDYAGKPATSGVLVLEVATWPANTRLSKAVAALGGNIPCETPQGAALVGWLTAWTKQRHRAKLPRDAAESLVELVGPELGLLDQELAKLSVAAGEGAITCELVDKLVGTWRMKEAWDMIDEVVDGNAPEAFRQLDRLLAAGEHPIALLAQTAATFRRFAAATRIVEENERRRAQVPLRRVLEQAGVRPFVLDKAERQMKQLGRQRAGKLYQILLDADLALKGRASQPARSRLVLEEIIAKLSTSADPRKRS